MSYRYIGNKTRIADVIVDRIAQHVPPGSRLADPMCGTAAMSAAFRHHGYLVTASDLMTFAVHHARVRLQLNTPPLFSSLGLSYGETLAELNSVKPLEGYFWNEYSPDGRPQAGCRARQYFSPDNARRIDAIRQQLDTWAGLLTELESSLLHHDLVLAANRVANIAGTYGHYRSTWSPAALKDIELRPTTFEHGPTEGNIVLQGAIEDLAPEIEADACYLDPPYMKRQYAANYHILETLARGDAPAALGVSGLRDWWDQYSDFCSKQKIQGAFERTIGEMKCNLFFISYSEDGLLSPEAMHQMFSGFGAVERYDILHRRFKSNQGGAGGHLTEYLYRIERR